MIELPISLISLIFSTFAIYWTVKSAREQKLETRKVSNLAQSIAVEAQLAKIPSALRFHGIDPAKLKEHGITPEEYAYLLNSFTVGRIYFSDGNPESKKSLKPGTYRYNMCCSADTRKAWPLIKPMLADCDYRTAIDELIAEKNSQHLSKRLP